jgi:hypothetical protein
MATALGFPEIHQALAFLISWPALEKAAQLVLRCAKELNGNHYEVLSPAADALAGKHPLAATLLLRSMIDFALVGGGDGVARIRGPRRHCSGRRADGRRDARISRRFSTLVCYFAILCPVALQPSKQENTQ